MSSFSRRRSSSVTGTIASAFVPYLILLPLYLWAIAAITEHIVFWAAGIWIPWFVAIFGGILGPVLVPAWFILWVLHFTSMHFPLFHG